MFCMQTYINEEYITGLVLHNNKTMNKLYTLIKIQFCVFITLGTAVTQLPLPPCVCAPLLPSLVELNH